MGGSSMGSTARRCWWRRAATFVLSRGCWVKPSERGPAIAAQEMEIELTPDQESACTVAQESPELYFCADLLGYGWCFRKGNHLNVGLGRVVPQQLPQQVRGFYQWMKRQGRLPDGLPSDFPGHAYLTYEQAARPLVGECLVWVGDAAGLSHNESGEGIRPAIQSGLLAAETIVAARGDYREETLDAYRRRMVEQFGPRRTRRATAPRDIRLSPPSRPLAARTALVCPASCAGPVVLAEVILRFHENGTADTIGT